MNITASRLRAEARDMWNAADDAARWHALATKELAKAYWRGLPGPPWVKVTLVVITLLIPGVIDDILIFKLPTLWKLILKLPAVWRYTAKWLAQRRAPV